MMRFVSLFVASGLLAACNGAGDDPATPDEAPPATASPADAPDAASASPTPTASATMRPSGARSISEETDDFLFEYSYPAEAGNIPELAALLDRRLDRSRDRLARQAARGRAEARDDGFPYNKYSTGMEWQVVADLPGWLSLSGKLTSYTGGAHGMYGMQSLVWDKQAEEALEGIALFTSPEALGEAVEELYCERLDRLRAERDAMPIEEGESVFGACPAIGDLTVLVGSSNGTTFDRLTLYAGPYVAGSYAEGAYEVNLDVDEAVLAAVKPQYRDAFSARN